MLCPCPHVAPGPARPCPRSPWLATLGLAGCGAAGAPDGLAGRGRHARDADPVPRPGDFVEQVDNPWLPLLPGAEWVYESSEGETITVTVTDRTREVAGVTTTVVRDVVTDEDGEVVEETDDWFAQDRAGNVWYFGEDTVEYGGPGRRRPDTSGSWEAGVDGAEAGIAMLARPRRGDGYEQEHAPGEAEDRATVLELDASLDLEHDSWAGLLVTEEHHAARTGPGGAEVLRPRHRAGLRGDDVGGHGGGGAGRVHPRRRSTIVSEA